MAGRRSTVLTGYFATAVVLISLRSQPMASAAAAAAGQVAVTIAGSVVDASLTPLSGVSVTAALGGKVVARATTDAQGKFKLSGLQPGEYVVRAERSGFPAFSRAVRIPGGTPTVQLPIVLARAEDKLERTATMTETVVGQSKSANALPPPPASLPARAGAGAAAGVAGGAAGGRGGAAEMQYRQQSVVADPFPADGYLRNGELYASVEPNRFHSTLDHPLSTFGADVDTASYTNVRRFLSSGQLPPRDAVRVEEFVNYFRFGYAAPRDGRPIALTTEIGDCPWAPSHKLVLIGARADRAARAARDHAAATSCCSSTCPDRWRRRSGCRSSRPRSACSSTRCGRTTRCRSSPTRARAASRCPRRRRASAT